MERSGTPQSPADWRAEQAWTRRPNMKMKNYNMKILLLLFKKAGKSADVVDKRDVAEKNAD